MTFGIPRGALPVLDDGLTLDLTYHRKWIARLLDSEENGNSCSEAAASGESWLDNDQVLPESSSIIERPGPCDVAFGRGTRWVHHPGNKRLKRNAKTN